MVDGLFTEGMAYNPCLPLVGTTILTTTRELTMNSEKRAFLSMYLIVYVPSQLNALNNYIES